MMRSLSRGRPRNRRKPSAHKVRRALGGVGDTATLEAPHPLAYPPGAGQWAVPCDYPPSDSGEGRGQPEGFQSSFLDERLQESGPSLLQYGVAPPAGSGHVAPPLAAMTESSSTPDDQLTPRIAWILNAITNHKKMVRLLMGELFTKTELSECSVTGRKGTRCDVRRRSLEPSKVNLVIGYVQSIFPEVSAADVRVLMAQKLKDERVTLKRMRTARTEAVSNGEETIKTENEPWAQPSSTIPQPTGKLPPEVAQHGDMRSADPSELT